jgi:hypothetical protein
MTARILLPCLLWAAGVSAAKLPEWYARSLEDAEFQARLVRDVGEIERVTGDRFAGDVILVEIKVRPLYGSAVTLQRQDFLLRSRSNNDTSHAQSPDRIAGSAVLELGGKRTTSSPSVFADDTNSPVWGGAPGTGTRPRRLGTPANTVGSGVAREQQQRLEPRTQGEDPVLERLHAIELPLETADNPVAGYLYFEIPAKNKRKHLELSYDGALGEFLIEFKKLE